MNETIYAWAIYAIYFAAIAILAVASRRGAKSFQSFSVGTRNISPVFIGFSVAASATSSATFVTNPGLVYLYGWSGFVAIYVSSTLGFFVGLFIFSSRFREIGDQFSALTIPQWLGDRYKSENLKIFFAAIAFLQVAYLVLVLVGMSIVLSKTLLISALAALIFLVIFTFSYILLGGAGTHIFTSSVQAMIKVVVSLTIVGTGLHYFLNGFGAFFEKMSQVAPHYASVTNPNSQLYRDYWEVFVAQFVIGLASAILPHILSKTLYLRSKSDVTTFLWSMVVVEALMKLVLLGGIFARFDLGGEVLKPDVVMATYLVEKFSPFMRALLSLGILAAGFSTLEGILLSLSSTFSNDFLQPLIKRFGGAEEVWREKSLFWARIFIALLVPITVLFSYQQIVNPNLSVLIFASHGIFGILVAAFAPMLYGIFFKNSPLRLATASAVTALVIYYSIVFFKITGYYDNPNMPATFAIGVSTLIMFGGAAFSPKAIKNNRNRAGINCGER